MACRLVVFIALVVVVPSKLCAQPPPDAKDLICASSVTSTNKMSLIQTHMKLYSDKIENYRKEAEQLVRLAVDGVPLATSADALYAIHLFFRKKEIDKMISLTKSFEPALQIIENMIPLIAKSGTLTEINTFVETLRLIELMSDSLRTWSNKTKNLAVFPEEYMAKLLTYKGDLSETKKTVDILKEKNTYLDILQKKITNEVDIFLEELEPALEESKPALETIETALKKGEPALETSEPALETIKPALKKITNEMEICLKQSNQP